MRIRELAKMTKKKAPKPDNRVIVIVLKDTPAYRDWFNGLSNATLIESTVVVRDALARWAAEHSLPPPPAGSIRPRRRKTN